jgi:two-component system, sporulation sensor kinase B
VRDFIEGLFLHFFIMMIIPLVYNVLYKQRNRLYAQTLLLSTILATLFLTMLYALHVANNTIFDLKFIPVFVGYFYISPFAGIAAITEIILFKVFSEPGSAILIEIVNYGIISIIIFGVKKFYRKLALRNKVLLSTVFYFLIFITRLIYFLNTGQSEYIIHLLLFTVVSCLALVAMIYLIEMNYIQSSMMNQLQNADKLNAISQLAASVAHEIRNPMTTIRGFLQLIQNEKNLTAKQKTYISLSLTELERTQSIINDFLSLARPSNHDFSRIDVTAHLINTIDFMNPFAVLSNVEIDFEFQEDLYIEGNPNELKQLMINILKNGIEAMPSGGRLWVTAAMSGKMVIISIADEGSGMSDMQINKLGQPYYSTKTKGTGLGLMISFDIIKRMNGSYRIESKENQGTCFTILFPAKP